MTSAVNKHKNISEILQTQAMNLSTKTAFTYLINEEINKEMTFAELDLKARKIALALRDLGVGVNDRALLIFPPGIDFISAFFGCLYAGVIAVPTVPPNKHINRLNSIVKDCSPSVIISTEKIKRVMDKKNSIEHMVVHLPWLAIDHYSSKGTDFEPVKASTDSIAFLQYTSGSTGNPKGVMISHGNLIYNSSMIKQAAGNNSNSRIVNWLPLHHDMGLVGGIIQPLFVGATCISMSPLEFLRDPIVWLRTISKYKINYTGGPNFAYDFCSEKITDAERDTLDLSSWVCAFNGSDTVRYNSLKRFRDKFQSVGFTGKAFCPAYGLAEATLMVTVGSIGQIPKISHAKEDGIQEVINGNVSHEMDAYKVSCGKPGLDLVIEIVNPKTLVKCQECMVGEIWVSGDSVGKGYWNNQEATESTFNAFTLDGDGPFLRTGDLGYLKENELYFKERLKDLLIIRGKNHYPQDIELTVESSHYSIKHHAAAAFTITKKDEEKLIIMLEIYRKVEEFTSYKEVKKAIRSSVADAHEIQVYDVVFLKEGTIPKTSSGKVQRKNCKLSYIEQSHIEPNV